MADGRTANSGATQARILRLAVPLTLALAIGLGVFLGLPIALLCIAGSVLVGAVFLFWGSMQSLTGETPLTLEEAVGLGAPSAEEERKRAVLRALKDLEYEHSVGKISEEDFRELSARYRQEAKRLLRMLDEDLMPLKRRLEAEIAVHLQERTGSADNVEKQSQSKKRRKRQRAAARPAGDATDATQTGASAGGQVAPVEGNGAPPSGDAAEDPDTRPSPTSTAEPDAVLPFACDGCGTANDADARFCKGCGQPLASAVEEA